MTSRQCYKKKKDNVHNSSCCNKCPCLNYDHRKDSDSNLSSMDLISKDLEFKHHPQR